MLYYGARKFCLTSRVGVKNNYQKFVLKRLQTFGELNKGFETKIIVSTLDCNTIDGTKQLLKECQALGQIGGLFHLSLILGESLMCNQTMERFSETIDGRYKQYDNFDRLTRDLDYKLDYFVIFSSISSAKGVGGHTSYGFGNSICERIAEQRCSEGLHGLALQYGPIGDVGQFAVVEQVVNWSNFKKQRINSCFDVLDNLLNSKHTVVATYVRNYEIKSEESAKTIFMNELCRALGIELDNTPYNVSLGQIGIESMFAVKLQQEMEKELKTGVTINNLKSFTIKVLKEYDSGNINCVKQFLKDLNTEQ